MNKSVSIFLHQTMNAVDVFMIRLLPSSIFRTKKVHISFDDVHDSFKMAIDKQYQSIFEIPFFNSLKELNSKYGVKLSLYIFEDPFLTYPKELLGELHRASEWLSVGYHADIDGNTSVKSFERFLNTFGKTGCVSGKARLHRFTAAPEVIEELKDSGIKELFCADDTRDSYGISDSDFLSRGGIEREGILYTKTDLRLEHFCFLKLISLAKKERLVLFAHENPYVLFDERKKLEAILKKLPSDVQYEN